MKSLNIPITDELKALLDEYSKVNGVNKKKVVELALEMYLNQAVPTVTKGDDTANPFDDHPSLR